MSAMGALIGLILSIVLIIRKISPAYSLILGALVGGLIGGFTLSETVTHMIDGVKDITPAILRILTAGILSGVLIKTGAAATISNAIIKKLGKSHVYLALALATFFLTAIGVFIDVAIITVAPIALSIGKKLSIRKGVLLVVMIGGGKCGNIISPNPNTIIAAENFDADLFSVMYANIIPALLGLIFTVYVVARLMPGKGAFVQEEDIEKEQDNLPSFISSMVAPVLTIVLLSLRPLFGYGVDPLIALPVGGIVGVIAMRKGDFLKEGMSYGLARMSVIAILLVGTGTIAGIIKASSMKDVLLGALIQTNLGEVLIAPLSGMLMGAATASSTAGATVASSSFAEIILKAGISGIWGAAMVNAGATVLDHLPHGSFFHATAGVTNVNITNRLKLLPYESAIGFVLAALSVFAYYLFSS
ncbi:SLC13 family permease [Gramella sp. AN32]|uniref:GntP family permease n=1 Tax=Christiangramia antarctica TaxID=2058158 RepID=A0ABW5X145_9FLAO|nr:SLC13 family permease [Gramella sp. AN32]MCM4155735.1 gluconate:proton symporter [Gramella sp. AN32]